MTSSNVPNFKFLKEGNTMWLRHHFHWFIVRFWSDTPIWFKKGCIPQAASCSESPGPGLLFRINLLGDVVSCWHLLHFGDVDDSLIFPCLHSTSLTVV